MRRKPAALILGLLLTAATVTSAGASFPGGDGRIVYLRFTSRAITPRTIRPDGTGDRELFNAPSGAYSFSVSADGRKLAFSTGKVSRIAILDRSTGHVTRVISATALHAQFLSSAAFSPDSSKLVICSIHRRAPTERLFVVGADGSSPTRISGDASMCSPDWSTTDRIVAAHVGRRTKIFTMDPDGGNVIETVTEPSLQRNKVVGAVPSWSPDGSEIVFVSAAGAWRTDVWRVDADGTGLAKLIHTPYRWDWVALYSPSGTKIAVSTTTEHGWFSPEEIWIYDADGTGAVRITDTTADEYLQTWIPN